MGNTQPNSRSSVFEDVTKNEYISHCQKRPIRADMSITGSVQTAAMSHLRLLTKLRHMSYLGQMTEMQTQEQGLSIPTWTLGWRLQRALAFADVSVEQIAEELGVSRSTVSRWLNDRGTPSLGYLKIWALRTGTPFSWLREGDIHSVPPVRPAGISAQPPGTAELRTVGGGIRKRIPLTVFQLLKAVA